MTLNTSPELLLLKVFLATSSICFLLMGVDKLSAIRRWRRQPERVLLLWAFLGGAAGGKLAQYLFRHKTVKHPFARTLNLWLLVNVLVYAVLLTPPLRAMALEAFSDLVSMLQG